jgi:hypothetical protein
MAGKVHNRVLPRPDQLPWRVNIYLTKDLKDRVIKLRVKHGVDVNISQVCRQAVAERLTQLETMLEKKEPKEKDTKGGHASQSSEPEPEPACRDCSYYAQPAGVAPSALCLHPDVCASVGTAPAATMPDSSCDEFEKREEPKEPKEPKEPEEEKRHEEVSCAKAPPKAPPKASHVYRPEPACKSCVSYRPADAPDDTGVCCHPERVILERCNEFDNGSTTCKNPHDLALIGPRVYPDDVCGKYLWRGDRDTQGTRKTKFGGEL